jgi:predicted nucleic acid-binding protein
MIAFDADVLTEILAGNAALASRAASIPRHEQGVPIVVIEEIVRGRLNSIRQAEAGRSNRGVATQSAR